MKLMSVESHQECTLQDFSFRYMKLMSAENCNIKQTDFVTLV
jgi:hypothetical protein